MIKINLVKKREKVEVGKARLEKEKIVKAIPKVPKVEYVLALFAWFAIVLMLVYYFRLSSERSKLRAEVDSLNAQKVQLQSKAKKFLEEKKVIEERIASLEGRLRNIERSKDILVGLKSYYQPFNQSLFSYTRSVPSISWISSYNQSLDINSGSIKTDIELQSLDYKGISLYSEELSSTSRSVSLTSLERKVNQHGFEYYTVRFSAERKLSEWR
ncbi:MAG: hypothetical protein ACK4SM_02200 [Aquificaceae bacterium]